MAESELIWIKIAVGLSEGGADPATLTCFIGNVMNTSSDHP